MAKAKAAAAEAATQSRGRLTSEELAAIAAGCVVVDELPASTRSSGPTVMSTIIEVARQKGKLGKFIKVPDRGTLESRNHMAYAARAKYGDQVEIAVRNGSVYVKVNKA